MTIRNKYQVARHDEMFDRLNDAKILSKLELDLKSGYYKIREALEDIKKAAFQTRYEHFEYLAMPVGITNAPTTFIQLMNHIF